MRATTSRAFASALTLTLGLTLTLAPDAMAAEEISGTWQMAVELDVGSGNPTFTFEQEEEKLTGTYQGTFGRADVTGTIKGNEVEFSFEQDGQTITYEGTVSGNTMEGTCQYGDFGSGTFKGEKKEEGEE